VPFNTRGEGTNTWVLHARQADLRSSGAIDLDELRERLEEDGNLVLARYQR
jgi:hypothetical protein